MPGTPFNPFDLAKSQLDRAVELLGLDRVTAELLREPVREFVFRIPVRQDDGTVRIFTACRIHHNDARGPARGGFRLHPAGSVDLARAQAMWMTWKCALMDVPLGGAYGGIACDPHALSAGEQERLCRGWVRALAREFGPEVDVPYPDLAADPRHMLWMLDEYEVIHRGRQPAAVTGKPVGMGGSLGRREATGFGLGFTIREALRALGLRPEKTTASFQGFGKVGANAALLLRQLGATVSAVSTWDPAEQRAVTFVKAGGVDPDELATAADPFGNVSPRQARALGYELLPGEAWLEQDVDVLVPAALENQITASSVRGLSPRVRLVAEGADGATTAEAEQVLAGRGVAVIPGLLANAGGVTGSYFEQVQSSMNYYWERDEVLGKLDVKMTAAYTAAVDLARKREVSLRDGALLIAVSRVAQACRGRGWV